MDRVFVITTAYAHKEGPKNTLGLVNGMNGAF